MPIRTGRRAHTGKGAAWCRTAVGSALAAGVLMVAGMGTAHADVLDDVYGEYATGRGGGQVSNLVHDSMKLRAQGFAPSRSNLTAIEDALAYRPNQKPLIDALKDTVAYQRKRQAQAANAQPSNPFTVGINQLPPGVPQDPTNRDNTGIFIAPGGSIQQPIGP
ncbi:hypothetical protein [Mycolicibacterium thermoresistibile]